MTGRHKLLAALRWAKTVLNLQHWRIDLSTARQPDLDVFNTNGFSKYRGLTAFRDQAREAYIWINPEPGERQTPLETLMHEMMHVAAVDVGIETREAPTPVPNEYLWNNLAPLLVAAMKGRRP